MTVAGRISMRERHGLNIDCNENKDKGGDMMAKKRKPGGGRKPSKPDYNPSAMMLSIVFRKFIPKLNRLDCYVPG